MSYIVKAPVENYGGVTAGVQFDNGVGKTDNPHVADWMREKGYEVSEEAPPKPSKGKGGKGGKGDEGGES